jgi:diadenosine tetraphosphate (Ap4A) HIT family hydrolase
MTDKIYPTKIHERVDLARRGLNETVICRMKSGWVVLGDDQRLPGYSLLLHDPVVESLNALSPELRIRFLSDMAIVGDAVTKVMNASIINYSILGNVDRALHAHIHPRYDNEEPDKRSSHPIIYHWMNLPVINIDYERDREMMEKIRSEITVMTTLKSGN